MPLRVVLGPVLRAARLDAPDLARDPLQRAAAGLARRGRARWLLLWLLLLLLLSRGGGERLVGVEAAAPGAGGGAVGAGEADAGVGAAAGLAAGGGVEVLGGVDGAALVDDGVGRAQVLVDDLADDGPAVGLVRPARLLLEVGQHAFAVALHRLDVAEEGVALGGEDRGGELWGGGEGRGRGVEGVEHGDAVGFGEGDEPHLVDEGLGGRVSKLVE